MITIFEGTDATGKSTAARWLQARTGGVLLHYGPPDQDPLQMYIGRVAKWVDDEYVILDRSSFGSLVWSRVGFHPPTMSPEVLGAVCLWYASRGARASILVREPEAIVLTLLDRGDESDHITPALAGQREYLRMMANHEILYIPTSLTSSDLMHHEMENH